MRIYAKTIAHPCCNLWLIHGYGESHTCFDKIFDMPLAAQANIFSVDLPGFGAAPIVEGSHREFIRVLIDAIKEQQISDLPCIILGHSMGGMIATYVVSQLSLRKMLLIAVDSSFFPDPVGLASGIEGSESAEDFKEALLAKVRAKVATQPNMHRLLLQCQALEAETLRYWLREGAAMRSEDQIVKAFKEIRCPKYYLVGEKSFAVDNNKKTRDLFEDSVLWVPEAGHWSMLDESESFWTQIEKIVNGLYAESLAEARHGVIGVFNPYKKCLPVFIDSYELRR